MDINRILADYNIPFITEGHSHTTEGWVNIHCPFCPGSRDFHLGINNENGACHCWRCGGHSIVKTISTILNVSDYEAKLILNKYKTPIKITKSIVEPKVSIHPFKFPYPYSKLTKLYKEYLHLRKFDPDKLERDWGLLQTGPASYLDKISYSHRIIIPIFWNENEIVSFQARDITGKSELKYIACPRRREKIHHKNILYGKPSAWEGNDIIIVEGVADVWRLGKYSAATFGIEFKIEQVRELAKRGRRFFVVFDNESQAQKQARKLAVKLRNLGKEVYIETVESDPGEMNSKDARHFVKYLLSRG